MNDTSAVVAGELASWPTKEDMETVLRRAGLRIRSGRYSIRVDDCSHFIFQLYGGDIDTPQIEVDAETVGKLIQDSKLVSVALSAGGIKHRFEVYDHNEEMVAYFHYEWPNET
jgi:hypothetical protein